MKNIVTIMSVSLAITATACLAQSIAYDQGVAGEILRNSASPQTVGALQGNQQLMLNYQVVALEQDLAREAVSKGLTERLDVQQALQVARRKILTQALRDEVTRGLPAPKEKELKDLYKQNPAKWVVPDAYQLDVIQIDGSDKKALDEARKLETGDPVSPDRMRLLNGRWIASQLSGQWFVNEMVVPEIWEKLGGMKDGEARLFIVNNTYLLIRRGAFSPRKYLTFEQARGQILATLQREQSDTAWNDYLRLKRQELGL